MKKYLSYLIISLGLILTLGCGYQFIDSQPLTFPKQATKLAIKKVVNPSQETWLESYIRNFLSEEISKRSTAKLTSGQEANLFLSIYLEQVSTSEQTKGEKDTTLRYAASLTLYLVFTDLKGERVLITKPITYSESYKSEAEKKEALEKAIREALRLSLNQLASNDF